MDRRNFLKVFGIGVGTAAATAATVISPTIAQAQKTEENKIEKTLKEIYAKIKEIDTDLIPKDRETTWKGGFSANIISFENYLCVRLIADNRWVVNKTNDEQYRYRLELDDTNGALLTKMFHKTQKKAGRNEFITRLRNGKLLTISDVREFVNC